MENKASTQQNDGGGILIPAVASEERVGEFQGIWKVPLYAWSTDFGIIWTQDQPLVCCSSIRRLQVIHRAVGCCIEGCFFNVAINLAPHKPLF